MFYVGIDIAKRKHEAVVTDDKGDIVVKPTMTRKLLKASDT